MPTRLVHMSRELRPAADMCRNPVHSPCLSSERVVLLDTAVTVARNLILAAACPHTALDADGTTAMTITISVAEAVGRTIARLGAAQIFGVVGSGNFHMTNAMIAEGVPYVATRHEMGAVCMADAYGRATGRIAVASVHQGCGLSNAYTGIGEAAKSHTPLLVVAGDTTAGDVTSGFYINQDAAVSAVGAVAERVHSASTCIADAARAYRIAVNERQAVVLSVPIDIQEELVEWDPKQLLQATEQLRAVPAPSSVEHVAVLLRSAQRPVILAGRGARDARAELVRLAELSGSLLVTSAAARGLFVGDGWALDIMGGFSTVGAGELISDADLIVAFGASLNDYTTQSGALLQNKTVVQIDDRVQAIGWQHPVDVGISGDARLAAGAIAEELERAGRPGPGYRTTDIFEKVQQWRYWTDQDFDSRAEADRVDPRALTNELDAILPVERVVVPDGGNFLCYPAAHLRVPDQNGFYFPIGFHSIGLSLSSAIGAAVASPDRLVVAGVGDGGFTMTLVELDTAVRMELGMVVVVYNDSAYGAEVHLYEDDTDQLETVVFPETDLAAIARGFGCDAITVRTLDDLRGVSEWLDGPRNRPLVIDAKVAKFASWVLGHAHQAGHGTVKHKEREQISAS